MKDKMVKLEIPEHFRAFLRRWQRSNMHHRWTIETDYRGRSPVTGLPYPPTIKSALAHIFTLASQAEGSVHWPKDVDHGRMERQQHRDVKSGNILCRLLDGWRVGECRDLSQLEAEFTREELPYAVGAWKRGYVVERESGSTYRRVK